MTRYQHILEPLSPDDCRHARMIEQRQTATLRSRYLEALTHPAYSYPSGDDFWYITKFVSPYQDLEPVKFPLGLWRSANSYRYDETRTTRRLTWRERVQRSWETRERGILNQFEHMDGVILEMRSGGMPEGWDAFFERIKQAGTAKGLIPCMVRRLSMIATKFEP